MKKYLATLKDKPHHHKQRFALLVSGIFTLAIFAVWSFVVFHQSPETVLTSKQTENEPGPLSSLGTNFASAFGAIKNDFENIKTLFDSYAR